jgi:hypothetical protein
MNRIVGVYAKQPPVPKPIPCDKMRCVTFVEKELIAKEKHMIQTPAVDTQRAHEGTKIMKMIANGAMRYAMPYVMN